MRILPINIQYTSFKGIKPPYTNNQGYYIMPMEKDPKNSEIRAAIEMTELRKGEDKARSTSYIWGDDKIIKKFHKPYKDETFEPGSEPVLLDKIQEDGLNHPSCEHGKYAFITPDGIAFMVSTKSKGDTIKQSPNMIKQYNLQGLFHSISQLDAGLYTIDKDKSGEAKANITRLIHNDISAENTSLAEQDGGISNFENARYVNITDVIDEIQNTDDYKTLNPNISDVGLLPANIRSFEYKALYDGILKGRHPRDKFDAHFYAKYGYCTQQYIRTKEIEEKVTGKQKEYLKDIEKGYIALSTVLANTTAEETAVKESEARKIQIARWLWQMSDDNDTAKINYNQVKEYIKDTKTFFTERLAEESQKENNTIRIRYFTDCSKLINAWDCAGDYIDESLKEPNPAEMSKEEYEAAKKHHDKMLSKSTDEKIETFDEIIKYNWHSKKEEPQKAQPQKIQSHGSRRKNRRN